MINNENTTQQISPIMAIKKISGRLCMSFSGPVAHTSMKGKRMTEMGMTIVISVATTGSKYLYIWYKPRKYQSERIGSGVTSGLERPPIAAGRIVATTTNIKVMTVRLIQLMFILM